MDSLKQLYSLAMDAPLGTSGQNVGRKPSETGGPMGQKAMEQSPTFVAESFDRSWGRAVGFNARKYPQGRGKLKSLEILGPNTVSDR